MIPNIEAYKTERWSADDFSYKIPIEPSNGVQTLVIKLSEAFFQNPG